MKYSFIHYIIVLCFFSFTNAVSAQHEKKQVSAVRTNTPPDIDARLNETGWLDAPVASDFIQMTPYNGEPASFDSEVKFLYDDYALYIGAMLYDSSPDSIYTMLSRRDDLSMADYFGVFIDPFNDALYAYGFFVTAAGVQVDMKASEFHQDRNWDAVWESAVEITDNGWVVEMKIPYSALRIPTKETQVWGLNTRRNIRRYRENTSWNFIDSKEQGVNHQSGELVGIQNIKPPLRLSFVPYIAGYVQNNSETGNFSYSLKGGMDVKYGINESFTLDMMLIPDFGHVQSDDEVLNLSPFETYYGEKRPFFMEGMELFDRGEIFYSRRIGGEPVDRGTIEKNMFENEKIIKNPKQTQLINATKITGKTTKGLGIGFLNAMTLPAKAEVSDTATSKTRTITTQPFTNYNMTVLDQSLKNNSYFSIANSNVFQPQNDHIANVTAADFKFANRQNSYALYGKGAVNHIKDKNDSVSNGFYYNVEFAKTSGNFRFNMWHRIESDTYNPNDMGFLMSNNEMDNFLQFEYNIYKPFWRILEMRNRIYFNHEMQYKPREFSAFFVNFRTYATFKNHLTAMLLFSSSLFEEQDFFESRVADRVFLRPASGRILFFFSSDYRKRLAVDFEVSYWKAVDNRQDAIAWQIEPRFRVSDKLFFEYDFEHTTKHLIGYVDHNNDSIYFGHRERTIIENKLEANYTFTNKISLNLRVRHYWSKVMYDKFYTLNTDGTLSDLNNYSQNENINYNTFNIDMVYSWNFAPGSEMSIVWKNAIDRDTETIEGSYFENLSNTLTNAQSNSLSIKLLYYLDYHYLKGKI